jgi:two-component system sensor histidine kinase/response regulator
MTKEKGARIFVVDDDPRNVRLLEGIFHAAGYIVDKACGGDEALERIAATSPDLVLLDVMMPGTSGHDVCRRLKADEKTRSIPVVLVTSLSSTEDKVEGLDIGADEFVSKPVNRLELLAKTRSLLRVKLLHDEVVRAKEELEYKNQELLRLEQLKELLTQMIVHDLKNPLTAIMGNLHLLLQPSQREGDRMERRVGLALDSSRVMMRMIMNLLDIGRLEENKLKLTRERVLVQDLIQASVLENGGLIASGGITVRSEAPPDLPPVWADANLLGRILGNLVSNAIKHTPEGGVITMGAEPRGDEVRIFVSDTGEGIPEMYHAMIFEKFRQAEAKRLGYRSDHGLGLTFCKMAVEAHGGTIAVKSAPGQGSTFSVSLPVARESAGNEAHPLERISTT